MKNAIRMLTILSRSKVPCEVKTEIAEEAVFWALTTLWTGSSVLWAYHTAYAICSGKPSALNYPMPF